MEIEKLNSATEAAQAPEMQPVEASANGEANAIVMPALNEEQHALVSPTETQVIKEMIKSNQPDGALLLTTSSHRASTEEPVHMAEIQASNLQSVADDSWEAAMAQANQVVEMASEGEEMQGEMQESSEEDEDEQTTHDYTSLNRLQLVELLEEVVQNTDVTAIKDKVAAIKVQYLQRSREESERELEGFLAEGGVRESFARSEDPLEQRFRDAFNKYKENKARYNELLEKQKQENLAAKQAILEELKALIDSEETLKTTYEKFKELQENWHKIGQVPASEISNLWNTYHFLVERFFDKVKINRELRDLDMRKNLEAKIQLCEKLEELATDKAVVKAFKMLQKYQDEWRQIGPVPLDKKDEIWERFRTAADKINENRRQYYKQLHEVQQKNYNDKSALCLKAEELASEPAETIDEWNKRTKEFTELFNIWRQIGPAPKEVNEEVWKRFKAAMDSFFEQKKKFFDRLKAQQLDNLYRKRDLCLQAEALAESTEWRKTTEQLKALQEEWKKIGAVPRKDSEKIWKRFRSACDKFFQRKAEYFGNIRGLEEENLKKKQELIEILRNFEISNDRNKNLEALKLIQRQWTEIGHVPMAVKDSLYAEFRKEIDKIFDHMKLSEQERQTTRMRETIESLRDEADSPDRIRRERIQLNQKINKLRDEIKTLENNIGFFSTSKQSELMRQEYEKKINKAKNELKLLETKLKLLAEA